MCGGLASAADVHGKPLLGWVDISLKRHMRTEHPENSRKGEGSLIEKWIVSPTWESPSVNFLPYKTYKLYFR